ncbi:YdbH domain-containing protein [Pseudomonas sp. MS19]|uniref:intermembrane phospholipid transport protein YdbH family protein n=1 Tax=Pseudomonas sp. MS19 TaxID=2579939 RepID=UPI0015629190|nr:hypothetical protein [Pseudomonas sp. MS19]
MKIWRLGHSLIGLLVLLIVLAVLAYINTQRVLQSQGIDDIDWQGLQISLQGVHVGQLSLRQHGSEGAALQLELGEVDLLWRQFSTLPPFWQHLRIGQATVDWQPGTAQETTQASAESVLNQLNEIAGMLPLTGQIDNLRATLPCASGRCTLLGSATLNKLASSPAKLQVQLDLREQQQRIALSSELEISPQTLQLQLGVLVDDQPQLGLHFTAHNAADGLALSGNLAAPDLNQATTLQRWLSHWVLPANTALPQAPGAASLAANWDLHAPSLDQLISATGTVDVQANLPEPWPVPGIGQLQGMLVLAADSNEQGWLIKRLEADLGLKYLPADLLAKLPAELQVEALQLRVQPTTAAANPAPTLAGRSLPLTLDLVSKGASNISLQGNLALANSLPWALQLTDATLTADTPRLEYTGYKLSTPKAQLQLDAYADAEAIELSIKKNSTLKLSQLSGAGVKLSNLEASTSGLEFSASTPSIADSWQMDGALKLSSKRLQHEQLHSLGWDWQGSIKGAGHAGDTPLQLNLDGKLSADSGLQLPAKISYASNGLTIEAELAELFLRAGNPLAKTLKSWPTLLDLNQGKLKADATLNLPAGNGKLKLDANITGKGVGGIYDRTEISGIDGNVRLQLDGQNLRADIKTLKIEEANPGIPVGPIQLRGSYNTKLNTLDTGLLKLNLAQAGLLGGNVNMAAGQWDMSQNQWRFPVNVRGLQLQTLFALYPAEGLSGSGLIDGYLPMIATRQGVHIDKGEIHARAPGGRLRFNNDKIKALGQSNPAMQLVAQSLEDFHYTTLNSDVGYSEQGKLQLGLRLEGQNPAIENGRPIHFNINLEENIPTLLASLQLSDKVSEIIQRRVQKFILERNNKSTSPKTP